MQRQQGRGGLRHLPGGAGELLGGRAPGGEAELLPLVLRGVSARLHPGGEVSRSSMPPVPGSYRVIQILNIQMHELLHE